MPRAERGQRLKECFPQLLKSCAYCMQAGGVFRGIMLTHCYPAIARVNTELPCLAMYRLRLQFHDFLDLLRIAQFRYILFEQ
jgi:hypothetical protein